MGQYPRWCRPLLLLALLPGALVFAPARTFGQEPAGTAMPPRADGLPVEERAAIPLLNRAAVEEAVRTVKPPSDGSPLQLSVALRLAVDGAGMVRQAVVDTTSCVPALDSAATRVAGLMHYAQAQDGGAAKLRGTSARLLFGADSLHLTLLGDSLPRKRPSGDSAYYDVGPTLLNFDYIRMLLAQNYPPALRKKGIGGQATIWVLVDTAGLPIRRGVRRGSGQCELDLAALRVADGMRFTPAWKRGKHIPLWVQLPIVFMAR